MCSWRICGNAPRTPQGLLSRLWCIKTLLEKSFSLLVKNDPKPRKGKQPTEREDASWSHCFEGKGAAPKGSRSSGCEGAACCWGPLWMTSSVKGTAPKSSMIRLSPCREPVQDLPLAVLMSPFPSLRPWYWLCRPPSWGWKGLAPNGSKRASSTGRDAPSAIVISTLMFSLESEVLRNSLLLCESLRPTFLCLRTRSGVR